MPLRTLVLAFLWIGGFVLFTSSIWLLLTRKGLVTLAASLAVVGGSLLLLEM